MAGLFPGKEYLGVDVRPGPGVDLVQDVQDMALPDCSVGTVLALSTLEHVPHFWRGLDEIHRVLRPDGALLVCCPFYFHLHEHPSDFWRFSPEALKMLFVLTLADLSAVGPGVLNDWKQQLLTDLCEHTLHLLTSGSPMIPASPCSRPPMS